GWRASVATNAAVSDKGEIEITDCRSCSDRDTSGIITVAGARIVARRSGRLGHDEVLAGRNVFQSKPSVAVRFTLAGYVQPGISGFQRGNTNSGHRVALNGSESAGQN